MCPRLPRVTSDVVGYLVDCCSQQTLAIVLVLGSIYCSMYDIVLMNMVFYCACGHFQCCVVVTLLCDFMIFWGGGGDIVMDVLLMIIVHNPFCSLQVCVKCYIVMVMMVTMILVIWKIWHLPPNARGLQALEDCLHSDFTHSVVVVRDSPSCLIQVKTKIMQLVHLSVS